jgi:hypothetical protein
LAKDVRLFARKPIVLESDRADLRILKVGLGASRIVVTTRARTSLGKSRAQQSLTEVLLDCRPRFQPMLLAFKIPDAPYFDRLFRVVHEAIDFAEALHATAEIFSVELTGLLGL